MTLTDPTSDAFEQRLRRELSGRAGTLDAPADGRERIERRVTRRRRSRRTGWLSAGVALVVIAGLAALALRPATDDSAPYVGTDTGGLPLLGFDTDTWEVTSYAPGSGYGITDDLTGDPDSTAYAIVLRDDSEFGGRFEKTADGVAVIGGRAVTVGTVTAVGADGAASPPSAGLWWAPTPGWTAIVTTSLSWTGVPARTVVENTAVGVVWVDATDWTAHLRHDFDEASTFPKELLEQRSAE